jgi:hypothetical protein
MLISVLRDFNEIKNRFGPVDENMRRQWNRLMVWEWRNSTTTWTSNWKLKHWKRFSFVCRAIKLLCVRNWGSVGWFSTPSLLPAASPSQQVCQRRENHPNNPWINFNFHHKMDQLQRLATMSSKEKTTNCYHLLAHTFTICYQLPRFQTQSFILLIHG